MFPGQTTMRNSSEQTGNVLIVVVLLLLLASVMTLFALNVGLFEQRTSGNDLRAKLVTEVAEAGLAQGMEYLRENANAIGAAGNWEQCKDADETFPCGAIQSGAKVQTVDEMGAPKVVDVTRRSTMYYWKGGGFDFDGDGAVSGWETKMLPINPEIPTTGTGFPTNYGVGPVLCRVAYKEKDTDPTVCTDDPAKMSPTSVLTFVSVGSLANEGARSTLTQTVGTYNILNNAPGKPPVVASGSVDVTGGLQIVTNPNAAGPGVPVSVWTRKDMTKTGTPNTCYYDEFTRFTKGSVTPIIEDGIVTCDDCQCETEHTISFDKSGNQQDEDIDILDIDTNQGVNLDVRPQDFPCDLFEFVFGVKSWEDKDGDYFCETKVLTQYKNPNTGALVTMGVDEAFLFKNALHVIPSAETTGAGLLKPSQIAAASYLDSNASGLIWCQVSCDIGASQQIGSPSHPVLLVIDGSAKIQGRVFGLILMRSLAGGKTLTPPTGFAMSSAEVDAGGNAVLDMNAGAVVYGSVVVQGQIDKANGTASIVYNADVLINLANDKTMQKFSGVPGGWSDDRVSY
jgi:Tfp pilus assembly protein PilX